MVRSNDRKNQANGGKTRAERLGSALKSNMAKRKAQAQARDKLRQETPEAQHPQSTAAEEQDT